MTSYHSKKEETCLAWQSSLALQVEANRACTVMRLGGIMENHVWGDICINYFIQKTVGVILGVISDIRISKWFFEFDLKKTNRKAKYNLVLNMYCIGFFCGLLKNNHSRDPPLKDFSKEIF